MNEKKDELNPKQELFCKLYATEREFFGNGVQTYIEVYEPDQTKKNWYMTACVCASQMLSNPKVCTRIAELLESEGLNDQNVDKQLLFTINQHADFKSKVQAIKEYNKLKQRITERLDIGNKDEKAFEVKDVNSSNVDEVLQQLLIHAKSLSKGRSRK